MNKSKSIRMFLAGLFVGILIVGTIPANAAVQQFDKLFINGQSYYDRNLSVESAIRILQFAGFNVDYGGTPGVVSATCDVLKTPDGVNAIIKDGKPYVLLTDIHSKYKQVDFPTIINNFKAGDFVVDVSIRNKIVLKDISISFPRGINIGFTAIGYDYYIDNIMPLLD